MGDSARATHILRQPPVADEDAAMASGGDRWVMGDDDDRGADVPIEGDQRGHDVLGRLAVEIAGRLIRQQNGGLTDQRPGDRHTLALAARHLVREMVQAVGQTDLFQSGLGTRQRLPPEHSPIQQRHGDVVERRQAGKQVKRLEDEADFPVADVGEVIAGSRSKVAPTEQQPPGAWPVQKPHEGHQRAFS
ncbi:hypothetical protein ABAZ39_18485 (plasmid) [Azospirillum argentinense]|uniref:Uncharacterized protein n=1 Tax=Azospirillum argentinense TaxID=2970906 RepID=A0A060DIM3_9PROT|nr:hypothetical protein ABAZ39_18485 [Azospirillum argentinense]EZQ05792.1 hypothetical protein ABAZ39_19635 [Azospirillum argentinense]